jgi:hypothetical protein
MVSPLRYLALLLLIAAPAPVCAQRWVGGMELPLVRQASAQRKAQATDTALASWRATAHGLVRLAPVGVPGRVTSDVPAKADELTVTVYGRLPDRIKQVISNWSDTVLKAGIDIPRYHRDHLGIVSSDFGDRIRLGDGDEVRDLIHPLSAEGLGYYEFALGDTLRIRTANEVILVVPVSVRPRDSTSPGTIGTLYIDPDRRTLVRFRFAFTPESYRDPSVIDITVTLESSLHNSTHWLPSRQSIVVRRTGRANGLLRADWEIRDYVLGERSEHDGGGNRPEQRFVRSEQDPLAVAVDEVVADLLVGVAEMHQLLDTRLHAERGLARGVGDRETLAHRAPEPVGERHRALQGHRFGGRRISERRRPDALLDLRRGRRRSLEIEVLRTRDRQREQEGLHNRPSNTRATAFGSIGPTTFSTISPLPFTMNVSGTPATP